MEEITLIQNPLNRTYEDKFLFIFNLPDALKNIQHKYVQNIMSAGVTTKAITMTLTDFSIPEKTIKSQFIPYGGGHLAISTHTIDPYQPFKINFKADDKLANYFTIYEWINFIQNERKGYFDAEDITDKTTFKAYTTNMSVVALDPYNNPIAQIMFLGAFPTSISSIDLNYKNTNDVNCSATFVFSQMVQKNFAIEEIKLDKNML